jgi:hypothetical protein
MIGRSQTECPTGGCGNGEKEEKSEEGGQARDPETEKGPAEILEEKVGKEEEPRDPSEISLRSQESDASAGQENRLQEVIAEKGRAHSLAACRG